MPFMTLVTAPIYMGLDRQGQYAGMYCDINCCKAGGDHRHHVITVEEMQDEEDDELWYDTHDGCRMPLFGHCCTWCEAIVWH
jgi:hypothetical protein